MKSLVDILEIPLILSRIQGYAKTTIGKQDVIDTTFLEENLLTQKAKEVDDMMRLMQRFTPLPIGQSHDLHPIISLIEKGSVIRITCDKYRFTNGRKNSRFCANHQTRFSQPCPFMERLVPTKTFKNHLTKKFNSARDD
ncbi:MAG: hypothetical protein ACO3C8_04350 [Bacilli bacterium]